MSRSLALAAPTVQGARARRGAGALAKPNMAVHDGLRATGTLIVSDVHLGLATSRPELLLGVLQRWRFDRLILLGDILHDDGFHRFGTPGWALLRHLRQLADRGETEVVWLSGNHDRHLQASIAALAGVRPCETYRWEQAGRAYLAVHGDRFDWFNHRFRRLGNLVGRAYGFTVRRLSREGRWPSAVDHWRIRLTNLHRKVAERAARFAREQGADVIVCGHTHRPLVRRFRDPDGGKVTYVNAGSWVDRHASFLTIDPTGLRIHHAKP